jgi:hypothetical protein
VTKADKTANTPAYQKFKAGHKGYKAAPHLDEASPIYSRGGEQRRTQTPRQIGVKSAPHNIPRGGTTISDRDPQGKRLFTGDQDRGKGSKAARRAAALKNEELDIFDVVLEFLQVEGFAETLEEAEWLIANVIDEEAIGIILDEAKVDKGLPEHERSAARLKRYGNPHGSVGSGPQRDRRAEHEERRGVKKEELEMQLRAHLRERALDAAEKKEKESVFKALKPSKLAKTYPEKSPEEIKSLRYAISTSQAKKNMDTSRSDKRYGVER